MRRALPVTPLSTSAAAFPRRTTYALTERRFTRSASLLPPASTGRATTPSRRLPPSASTRPLAPAAVAPTCASHAHRCITVLASSWRRQIRGVHRWIHGSNMGGEDVGPTTRPCRHYPDPGIGRSESALWSPGPEKTRYGTSFQQGAIGAPVMSRAAVTAPPER